MPDSEQGNLIYGGQVYDCAIVIALAAEAAQSTDPAVFNDEIEGVTSGGTECTSFEECTGLLDDGRTSTTPAPPVRWTWSRPDPTFGRYAIGQFTADGLEIVGSEDVDLSDLG